MKKRTLIIIIAGAGAFLALGIWILAFPDIDFRLNGDPAVVTGYQEPYSDAGAALKVFGIPAPGLVKASGAVDVNKLGTYQITYAYSFGFRKGELIRAVEVKDLTPPVISASFSRVIYLQRGNTPALPDFTAADNVDGDVSASLTIGAFDNCYLGVNYLTVTAQDASGNVASYIQPVYVYDEGDSPSVMDQLADAVYGMSVSDDKWVIYGYAADQGTGDYRLALVGKETVDCSADLVHLDTGDPGYYSASLSVGTLANGTYRLQFGQGDAQAYPAIRYENPAQKLGRWHIGDKLVTWSYDDGIAVTVEDFAYQYDIAIDVGHGSDDPGASSLGAESEAELNLMVSLYEKQRYESFGLKVWLIREGTDYGELLGDSDWGTLQKVSWTTGWYGAVSRYTYSNHHNSDENGYYSGAEIIVLPDLAKESLGLEFQLTAAFRQLYPYTSTDWPIFTRDYNTGKRYSRLDGTAYPGMRCYYANMRYPYEDFGVKVTTYEACYLNNRIDYRWYVTLGNWKAVSEAKIKAYVEALGITYTAPD